MNVFEHMLPQNGYTAQELADLIGDSLKNTQTELMDQFQKGKIGIIKANGYEFFFIKNIRTV